MSLGLTGRCSGSCTVSIKSIYWITTEQRWIARLQRSRLLRPLAIQAKSSKLLRIEFAGCSIWNAPPITAMRMKFYLSYGTARLGLTRQRAVCLFHALFHVTKEDLKN